VKRRREVDRFADAMEAKLAENDSKGGWEGETLSYLLRRLGEEGAELHAAVAHWKANATGQAARVRVLREAADVANFAMMVADVCGAL